MLTLGIYRYNVLPMGLIVSVDVFQEAMGKLMADLEKVFVYMNDITIIGDDTYEKRMKDVKEVVEGLVDKGVQVNPNNLLGRGVRRTWLPRATLKLCNTISTNHSQESKI